MESIIIAHFLARADLLNLHAGDIFYNYEESEEEIMCRKFELVFTFSCEREGTSEGIHI